MPAHSAIAAGLLAGLTVLALSAGPAAAQYDGPGFRTCEAYANRQLASGNASIARVVLVNDRETVLDRYTAKVGSQFVSSVLSGNGLLRLKDGAVAGVRYVCLLASDKQAVFFRAEPRQVGALEQCRAETADAGDLGACLQRLLDGAQGRLDAAESHVRQEAQALDRRSGRTRAAASFDEGERAWRAWRDGACAYRREAAVAAEGNGEHVYRACQADLTRRRAAALGEP